MPDLSYSAIKAALANNWEEAISLNLEILENTENDISALSRLAYAYLQTGKINKSKDIYLKILQLDKYNTIAQKNLDKIKVLPKNFKASGDDVNQNYLSPSLFIEEPGKTKTITLINPAPSSILSHLNIGDQVTFFPKKHSIEVRNQKKIYIGALPDDIAFRLLRLLKGGNQYQICIKNSTKNSISIFVKELKRGKRFLCQPSFINLATEQTKVLPRENKTVNAENYADDEV